MDAGPRIAVIQSRSPMARSEVISLSGIENICIGVSLAMAASGHSRRFLRFRATSGYPLRPAVKADVADRAMPYLPFSPSSHILADDLESEEMARKAGSADLPLHGGHVPRWLSDRMTRLGAVITHAIVHHYGRDEFLRRVAHPFWFQSFGALMGMDWHSSGITTSVLGALKRGLNPLQHELGIHVCGGRGKHSRKTPQELVDIGERTGFDGAALATASRLVAKVDSAAVQDGFDLYLHGFIVTDEGRWTVVQQGMNEGRRQARRYHWLSEAIASFVEEPHRAIDGPQQ